MKVIYLFFLTFILCNIIEIPFYKEINDKKDLSELILYNKIYTFIDIGEPKQKIKTYFNFTQYYYYITDINLNGIYNKNNSKTYSLQIPFEKSYSKQEFDKGYSSLDNIYFQLKNNEIKLIEKFPFILVTKSKKNLTESIIELNYGIQFLLNEENFIYQLKQKKIISSYYFSIKYEDNNKWNIIIGDLPHLYDNTLSEEYYINAYSYLPSYQKGYDLKFNLVSYGNVNFQYSTVITFNNDYYGLISNHQVKEIIDNLFFEKYFKENKCFYDKFNGNDNTIFYYCNKNIDIAKFNGFSFYQKEMNYTFSLNYKDLFIELNGKYYFLIFFNENKNSNWIFGEIFFRKFQMTFEQEKKIIGFYIRKKKISSENTYFLIIVFLLILILGLIYIIYNLLIKRHRRKKANELIEDYDYIPNELHINN